MKIPAARGVCVLSVLVSVSLAVNVLQGLRIGRLQAEIDQLVVAGGLRPGEHLPVLHLKGTSGAYTTIDYRRGAQPTVIYVLRPSCVWCQRNSNSVAALARALANRYTVVGISLSGQGLADFVEHSKTTFPVYQVTDDSALDLSRLRNTPETILVASDGTVLRSWRGAYVGQTKKSIEHFFSIRLPDPELDRQDDY